ncbi:putative ATP-dependent helicase IRC3 [Microbotryomycetes sp. JL221]|nr:putative ATP-dependent helicase IRC3 [Microbotryomycetes sp. JL221]
MRPYQIDCINAVLQQLERQQHTRLGVSAPTGSGKTAIFTELVERLPTLLNPITKTKARQVLILVGSIVLANQATRTVKTAFPHLTVELEQGTKNVASGFAAVTIATYQTLAFNDFARLEKFNPAMFKAVIIDEAHHAVARSYLTILQRFDPRIASVDVTTTEFESLVPNEIIPANVESTFQNDEIMNDKSFKSTNDMTRTINHDETILPTRFDEKGQVCVPLIAFTATWSRADGLGLSKVFEKIVWHGDWLDMIKASWLSQLRFTIVRFGETLDLSKVRVSKLTGDYNLTSLAKAIDKTLINRLAVESWFKKTNNQRRSTLVFAVNIDHVVSVTNEFRQQGVDARFVHEGVHVKEREALYEEFRRGEFPVLVNCSILTEGADFPMIDCILLVRPTRSKNLFLQMIGRGLRLSPDTNKQDCLIIDMVGNVDQGLVCTPTLFGLDPNDVIEAESTATLEQRAIAQAQHDARRLELDHQRRQQLADVSKQISLYDFESVFEMQTYNESGPVRLASMTNLSWTGVGHQMWVLELATRGYVKICLNDESKEFEAVFYRRLKNLRTGHSLFARPVLLHRHRSLQILFQVVDADVLSNSTLKSPIDVKRNALWRKGPTSEQQVGTIVKRIGSVTASQKNKHVNDQIFFVDGIWIPGHKWSDRIDLRTLTRGQASDLICRLTHGGKSFVERAQKLLERSQQTQTKAAEEILARQSARRALGLES